MARVNDSVSFKSCWIPSLSPSLSSGRRYARSVCYGGRTGAVVRPAAVGSRALPTAAPSSSSSKQPRIAGSYILIIPFIQPYLKGKKKKKETSKKTSFLFIVVGREVCFCNIVKQIRRPSSH